MQANIAYLLIRMTTEKESKTYREKSGVVRGNIWTKPSNNVVEIYYKRYATCMQTYYRQYANFCSISYF